MSVTTSDMKVAAESSIKNVFIIGSGNVSKICLSNLATTHIGAGNKLNITVYNPTLEHAQGVVLDTESSSMQRLANPSEYPNETVTFSATNDLKKMSNAHLIVIVAGKFPSQAALEEARKKGTDREIQAITNAADIETFAKAVKQYN